MMTRLAAWLLVAFFIAACFWIGLSVFSLTAAWFGAGFGYGAVTTLALLCEIPDETDGGAL